MNAGFSNLTTLKEQILASSLQAGASFDKLLVSVGLGVASLVDSYCNRKFAYLAGASQIIHGQREHYYLPRYPIVEVTSLEVRYSNADAWEEQEGQPFQTNPETGLVEFLYTLGARPLQARITWSGGYWFETKEKTEDGFPTAQPEGATAMPDDIVQAWILQCRAAWQAIDKLGTGIATEGSTSQFVSGSLAGMDVIPMVKRMLDPHRRLTS